MTHLGNLLVISALLASIFGLGFRLTRVPSRKSSQLVHPPGGTRWQRTPLRPKAP